MIHDIYIYIKLSAHESRQLEKTFTERIAASNIK
jgi:hypothetical protein